MQTQPVRIALTGKMRSGKSTIAWRIADRYGLEHLSFGSAVKRITDDLFKYKYEPVYHKCTLTGISIKDGYRKPRELYQRVGQLMREVDENVWIKQLEQSMRVWENRRDVYGTIIDDLRQPNEFEWAKDNGFTVIRINASEQTRIDRARKSGDDFTKESLYHETESYIDGFPVDYEFTNEKSGDLDRVCDEISNVIDKTKEAIN